MRRTVTLPLDRRASARALAVSLALAVAAMGAAVSAPAVAAESCWRDDDGRILRRRRPGATRVPCPGTAAADTAGSAAATIEAQETTGYERRSRPGIGVQTTDSFDPMRDRRPNAPSGVPRPGLDDYVARVPMPDRWRIVNTLGYPDKWWDPYNQNTLKGDRPVFGEDWFVAGTLISDSVAEYRQMPTPVGGATTRDPGGLNVIGSPEQVVLVENIAAEAVVYKGDTVFRPPDWEIRFTPVFSLNHVILDERTAVNVNPRRGAARTDTHVGVQAAFVDRHLRNVSERYDFDSIRVGIQPFNADFRGFLFQDNQFGVRLFGTRDNNIFQYNLAWFRRLEKDTNSGLNDVGAGFRNDDVVVANLYWQDFPRKGFFSQATVLWNHNTEDDELYYDRNGFIARPASLGGERPRAYDVWYLGLNGDGHVGRLNLTGSFYYAVGDADPDVFVDRRTDINAWFAAAEASLDQDWIRLRASVLFSSGDEDPYDGEATGFDAVFENPQFAGSDTSYWIRQGAPLIGGGRVALSGRNGVLPSLRSSKEQGQSNFTNPGLLLLGFGADVDVLPSLRASFNWNWLRFDDTAVLEAARNQAPIDAEIGHDVSLSLIWRPLMTQNIVVRASQARLIAADGWDDLYPDESADYFLLNVVLTF